MKWMIALAAMPVLSFGLGGLIALGAIGLLPVVSPQPDTLLEAALLDRERLVARMLFRGAKADAPTVLNSNLLHWKKGDTVTPLLVVAANGNDDLLHYLIGGGARLDTPPNDQALCIAAQYAHGGAARVLIQYNAPWMPAGGCGGTAKSPLDIAEAQGLDGLAAILREHRDAAK